jgi:hypothetical protein
VKCEICAEPAAVHFCDLLPDGTAVQHHLCHVHVCDVLLVRQSPEQAAHAMLKCAYCNNSGLYRITVLNKRGRVTEYAVCEAHADEQPEQDGILRPPSCPICATPMSTGTMWNEDWIKTYFYCGKCGHRQH